MAEHPISHLKFVWRDPEPGEHPDPQEGAFQGYPNQMSWYFNAFRDMHGSDTEAIKAARKSGIPWPENNLIVIGPPV